MSDLLSNTSLLPSALRRLSEAAAALGAALPHPVVETLTAEPPLPPSADEAKAAAARAIASAATLAPKAAEKAVGDALDALTRSEAVRPLRARIRQALDLRRLDAVEAHEAEILSVFADVLAPDFDALNTHSGNVPLNTADPSALSPEQYRALYESRTAAARVETMIAALAPFYPVPGDHGSITEGDWRKMLVLDVTDADGVGMVHALREALPRKAPAIGAITAPWWLLAGMAGARFAVADRATRRANAAHLAASRAIDNPSTPGQRLRLY